MDVCHLGGFSDRKTIYMQIEHKIQVSDMPRGARRVRLRPRQYNVSVILIY